MVGPSHTWSELTSNPVSTIAKSARTVLKLSMLTILVGALLAGGFLGTRMLLAPFQQTPETGDEPVSSAIIGETGDELNTGLDGVEDHLTCESSVVEVCNAVRFVETIRGRAFKTFPTVLFLDAQDFVPKAESLMMQEPRSPQILVEARALQVLGLIDAAADVASAISEVSAAGILGIYSTDEETTWVRGGDLSLLDISILIHELTHAFDDQWFDLDSDALWADESDQDLAIAAVIEGNAMRIEDLWRATLSDADRRLVVDMEFNSLTDAELLALNSYPQALLEIESWPYTEGQKFSAWVAENGGEMAVDNLFGSPPQSTEQVLDPEAWLNREPAVRVKRPDFRGRQLGQGTLGALVVSMLLGDEAAFSWGGDRFVLFAEGPQRCVALSLVSDSDDDLTALTRAGDHWLDSLAPLDSMVEVRDGTLSLESCL